MPTSTTLKTPLSLPQSSVQPLDHDTDTQQKGQKKKERRFQSSTDANCLPNGNIEEQNCLQTPTASH
jgi:hypothetical protein